MNYLIKDIYHRVQFRLRYSYDNPASHIFKFSNNWYLVPIDILPFLKNKKVIYKLRNGVRFLIRLNSLDLTIVNEIALFDIYNLQNLQLSRNARIIDIGAHIGIFSVLIAQKEKTARVYCFEPFEDNFLSLKENVELNKLNNRIMTFKLGIGQKKKAKLYLDSHNSGGHSLYTKTKNTVTIDLVSLSEVFKKENIKKCDVLKLDCEGAEYEILYSLPKTQLRRIKHMIIEYHPNGDVNQLILYLEKNNFKVRKGREFFPILFADQEMRTH